MLSGGCEMNGIDYVADTDAVRRSGIQSPYNQATT